MAVKEVVICDRCGVEVESPITFYVPIGLQPDAAGGPSEVIKKRVDLCTNHARWAIEDLLKTRLQFVWDYQEYEKWYNVVVKKDGRGGV